MCGTDLRGATPDLADTLGYRVCRGKELLRLVVQNYVIVAKVWSGHVPVKILRLQIQCENISRERVEVWGDLYCSVAVIGAPPAITGMIGGAVTCVTHDFFLCRIQ
jgi:hypothetical protein